MVDSIYHVFMKNLGKKGVFFGGGEVKNIVKVLEIEFICRENYNVHTF